MLPEKEKVLNLINKYSTTTKDHLFQVGIIMEYFGENSYYWRLVGVLHDIDWDFVEKNGEKHLKEDFEKIMSEIGASEELIGDIRSHGHFLPGISEKPDTLIRKYINAVDELSGFIWAYFRMIPSENPLDIKVSSIKKKLKDKAFAAGVDRTEAINCETLLNISLDEFIEDIKVALNKGNFKK